MLLDEPVEMDIDEVQSRRRPPVAKQAFLEVLQLQRFLQQRIVTQIDLPDREVIRGAPVGVHVPEELARNSWT
jgi:predicted nucleotidyltransferase